MAAKIDKDKEISRLEPPQSIDAEQQIIGAILKDTEAISAVIEIIDSEDHFYVPRHRIIFRAILGLYEKMARAI